ncbi:GNAT family N-acetyltransferase [Micromonospora sp. b486]|uniref:GNAT family N-acetyltransferase n=1 Tax=Micromonospora sp. b486 TaxID=3053986 RepID=UPI00259D10E4|nr:GNAT family N-acetyltransferase [Micromonospora sp. b486]MDM4784376.1 GNAT family N-acetyltransferase [Micromonospora sp. b486]
MPPEPARTVVSVAPDGAVLGSAKLAPNQGGPGDHVANASFMVAPAAAGRGVGRALAAHLLDAARADGYRAMQFNAVVATNTRAVGLWRSLGFEVIGRVPEGFRHPRPGVRRPAGHAPAPGLRVAQDLRKFRPQPLSPRSPHGMLVEPAPAAPAAPAPGT